MELDLNAPLGKRGVTAVEQFDRRPKISRMPPIGSRMTKTLRQQSSRLAVLFLFCSCDNTYVPTKHRVSGPIETGGTTFGSAGAGGTAGAESGSETGGSSTSIAGSGGSSGALAATGGGASVTSADGGAGIPATGDAGSGNAAGNGANEAGRATSGGGISSVGGATNSAGVPTCVQPVAPGAPAAGATDVVNGGTLLQFNDNGGWCWYQDERAIVDVAGGKLVIGSVASGGARDAQVEATIYDLNAKKVMQTYRLGKVPYTDDHDAPALILRPDGKYVAMWAGHNNDCFSYSSVYDGSAWTTANTFDWAPEGCVATNSTKITYANLWYLGDKQYSAVRSIFTSPNFLVSSDNGSTWAFGGRLTSTPTVGYVAGYYKYWGNNRDRLDFVGTEAHPRDNDNSLYHGYIQNGKIYNSTGIVVDEDATDRSGQEVTKYTQLFKTGTTIHGVKLEHAWNADLVRYDDGTVALIWTARVSGSGTDDPDKRLLYARFDGSAWQLTYLGKAGNKLYASEQDYTGLGALHPDDPHTIYISTTYDPRDDTTVLAKHEIFQGTTCDNGVTFSWVPITQNSTLDNLRPIVPKWDSSHTALLWLNGTYVSAQQYQFKIVGLITP